MQIPLFLQMLCVWNSNDSFCTITRIGHLEYCGCTLNFSFWLKVCKRLKLKKTARINVGIVHLMDVLKKVLRKLYGKILKYTLWHCAENLVRIRHCWNVSWGFIKYIRFCCHEDAWKISKGLVKILGFQAGKSIKCSGFVGTKTPVRHPLNQPVLFAKVVSHMVSHLHAATRCLFIPARKSAQIHPTWMLCDADF